MSQSQPPHGLRRLLQQSSVVLGLILHGNGVSGDDLTRMFLGHSCFVPLCLKRVELFGIKKHIVVELFVLKRILWCSFGNGPSL